MYFMKTSINRCWREKVYSSSWSGILNPDPFYEPVFLLTDSDPVEKVDSDPTKIPIHAVLPNTSSFTNPRPGGNYLLSIIKRFYQLSKLGPLHSV